MTRFDLADSESLVIQPSLPTKVRGVPRVDDRRVLHAIIRRRRAGCPGLIFRVAADLIRRASIG